jgi:hypothetical protein
MLGFGPSLWCGPWAWSRMLQIWWIPAGVKSGGRRGMRIETRKDSLASAVSHLLLRRNIRSIIIHI